MITKEFPTLYKRRKRVGNSNNALVTNVMFGSKLSMICTMTNESSAEPSGSKEYNGKR